MNDQEIMENLLQTTKGACDLYLHGSIESADANVHEAFHAALDAALCMQNELYGQMAGHGWYATEAAEAQKIQQLKQKYAA